MANISHKAAAMPASAIRKLVPLADEAKAAGTTVYHLNLGQPDIKSPECALEAVRNYKPDHISYTNSAGLIELRKGLIEKYYSRKGIDIPLSSVIVTVAGSEGVDLAVKICCDEGDEIIALEPFYTNYNTFAYMNGVTIKAVPTDMKEGFKVPSPEAFESLVTPRTRAILISNPGNPTGTLYSKEQILSLGEIARKHDLFLISDEVYREFCYTTEPHFSAMQIPDLDQNVILVDSVSKRYNLCGCRIGCIISRNQEVMAAAMKYAQARLCPPVLGQVAAIGALDTPDSYFDAVKEEYIRRRDYMISRLNAMEGVFSPVPDGAFYTVASIPVDDAENFARWMLSEFRLNNSTTMVTPAASFYKDPLKGKNHVRLAYVLEIDRLEKAMDVLEAGLEQYPGRSR